MKLPAAFEAVRAMLFREKREGQGCLALLGSEDRREQYSRLAEEGALEEVIELLTFRKVREGDTEPLSLTEFLVFIAECQAEIINEERSRKAKSAGASFELDKSDF